MNAFAFKISMILGLGVIFVFGTGFTTKEAQVDSIPPHWEQLGKRKVNYRLDRDEVFVTAREGRFRAVKLKIKNAPVNVHKAVIHYANGSKQEFKVRKVIPAGGSTRVIDIQGRKRIIKKVVFWYDTKGIARGKSVVELWGRR